MYPGHRIDGTEALCPRVAEFLTSENTNLLVDAIRTLGMLRYAPATEDVRAFTQHPSWIVRSVAATALSELAPDECYEDLLRCLCDSEWWVRFHAAEALADLKDHPALEDDVKGLSDRFAYDMIRFILERNALLKEAQAV